MMKHGSGRNVLQNITREESFLVEPIEEEKNSSDSVSLTSLSSKSKKK
jgi:hypothetical protein